jgi:2-polyprenyl-3-methyl-5-hydroxy-6-metoxy-1,4-benzoquinol methylase
MNSASHNDETRAAWDANAEVWDARMADEGNDFVNMLQWPALQRLIDVQSWSGEEGRTIRILDAACGNGIFSRRLARLGAQVLACDFSQELLSRAASRTPSSLRPRLEYRLVDLTDETDLLRGLATDAPFDLVMCNMALFDIADIGPLFRAVPRLLASRGAFVFSLTHPCFNTASSVHVAEEIDEEGKIKTTYSIKMSRYMTPYEGRGLALVNQPMAQYYFERPLQYYLNLGFENGLVLDGFEERAFPPDHPQSNALAWGGNFSEIPPVLVARMRVAGRAAI